MKLYLKLKRPQFQFKDRAVRRYRRELSHSFEANITDPMEWDYMGNYTNSLDAVAGRFNRKNVYRKVSFRRIPKEVNLLYLLQVYFI